MLVGPHIKRGPPLVDHPNHLARVYIIYHYNDVEAYQSMYDKLFSPTPNMAVDLLMPPLLRFIDVEVAGKLFLTLTLLLFIVGCHLLGHAIQGKPTWLALVCAFLSYNLMLLYGFMNYLFGLAIFMVTLAVWLKQRKRWDLKATLIVSVLVFASYLAHLSAYSFLGVTLVTVTFCDYLSAKRITQDMIAGLVPLLPPVIAFAMFMEGSGEADEIRWNTAEKKVLNLVSWLVGYNYVLEGVLALVLVVLVAAVVYYSKQWQIKWAILMAGCMLVVLFLVFPQELLTGWAADIRFMPPAVILMLLSIQFKVPKRVGQCALLIFLSVSLIRVGSIWHEWSELDGMITTQVEMFNRFEDGARVYPMVFSSQGRQRKKIERSLRHIIHYSTIHRHTFSPTLFALKGQQPLVFKSKPKYLHQNSVELPDPKKVDYEYLEHVFDNYDYLWCYRINDSYLQYLKDRCELVAEDPSGFMIFRLNQ